MLIYFIFCSFNKISPTSQNGRVELLSVRLTVKSWLALSSRMSGWCAVAQATQGGFERTERWPYEMHITSFCFPSWLSFLRSREEGNAVNTTHSSIYSITVTGTQMVIRYCRKKSTADSWVTSNLMSLGRDLSLIPDWMGNRGACFYSKQGI